MSISGMKNLIQPREYGNYLRAVKLVREDELFHSEAGPKPLSKGQAYEMGQLGEECEWRRLTPQSPYPSLVAVLPAMPVDCIRPFDAGLGINYEERLQEQAEEYDGYYDSVWTGEDYGPMDSKYAAFFEEECEKSRQEDMLWEAWDRFNTPIFLTLVSIDARYASW